MKSSFFNTVMLLSLLELLTSPLQALEFRVLLWSNQIGDDIRFKNGQQEFVLNGDADTLSSLYKLSGTGPLKLYRLTKEGEKSIEQTVATLPQPAGMTRAILILSPSLDSSVDYSGLWLDDSAKTNPAASFRVYNLSGHSLVIKVGKRQVPLEPQATEQFHFEASARSVPVQVAAQVHGQWKLIIDAPQPVRARFRFLFIIRDGRDRPFDPTQLLDGIGFYDVPEPSEAPVATERFK